MATICFYQDSRHSKPLDWIKKQLKIGYVSNRNDGITELRINGFEKVEKILKMLSPFIKFRKNQTKTVLKAINLMQKKDISELAASDYKKLINFLLDVQNDNYQSSHKKTKQDLEKIFGLTP